MKIEAYIRNQKTHKQNHLYLTPLEPDLLKYRAYYAQHYGNLQSVYLFPKPSDSTQYYTEHQFYKVMAKVGDMLWLDYLGTHTMRKTGAYMIYK